MKTKTNFVCLCAFFMGVAPALYANSPETSGKQPFVRAQHDSRQMGALQAPQFTTVVDEDFSKFTAGTETSPDKTDLHYESGSYLLNPDYFKIPNWRGDGVWQANGACYLGKYTPSYGGEVYGFISTPEMELYGDVVLTLRAKRAPGAGSETYLYIQLCDNTSGPVDYLECTLTDEWQTFEMKSSKATFNDRNIMQLAAYEGEVLLDDVVLKRARTKIETPMANPVINNSSGEFVASWTKVKEAKEYLLDVYYRALPDDAVPPTTYTEDFEGFNLNADETTIDRSNPGYPDGWTIDVSSHGSQDASRVEGTFSSGRQSLVFDEVDDYIMTPVTDLPINEFSFWVKPSSMDTEPDWTYSMLSVEVFANDKWVHIANIPNYWMEDGGVYTLGMEALGEGVKQVKLGYIQKNMLTFAIDDVSYTCATQKQSYPILKEKAVTDTFCIVSGIDPTKETYYYVKAKDGDVVSDPSATIWVDGIVGLSPKALPATNVSATDFTANWETMPNATQNQVNVYRELKKEHGTNGEVVVMHETFDQIEDGTIDQPIISYNLAESLSEHGLTDTEWICQLPSYAKGMAGAQAANYYFSLAGLVVSPRVSMDNNGGSFDVDLKAYGTMPGDTLFVMILKEYTGKQAIAAMKVPFLKDKAGMISGTAHFDRLGIKDMKIAFMSMYGEPFFIDEVTVRQQLSDGESLLSPYKTTYTDNLSTMNFGNLPSGYNYAYNVTASTVKDYVTYKSDTSNTVVVNNRQAAVETPLSDGDPTVWSRGGVIYVDLAAPAEITVYNLQGMLLHRMSAKAAGTTSLPCSGLSGGMVIVKVGNDVVKIIVK